MQTLDVLLFIYSQVVLKHLNEFGASIIVDFKRKNKLKERHVEDGGIGGGGGSIELSGGGGGIELGKTLETEVFQLLRAQGIIRWN